MLAYAGKPHLRGSSERGHRPPRQARSGHTFREYRTTVAVRRGPVSGRPCASARRRRRGPGIPAGWSATASPARRRPVRPGACSQCRGFSCPCRPSWMMAAVVHTTVTKLKAVAADLGWDSQRRPASSGASVNSSLGVVDLGETEFVGEVRTGRDRGPVGVDRLQPSRRAGQKCLRCHHHKRYSEVEAWELRADQAHVVIEGQPTHERGWLVFG
jgi:hypothetical protein